VHVVREAMLGVRRPVRYLVTARGTSSTRVRAYFDDGRDAFRREAGTLTPLRPITRDHPEGRPRTIIPRDRPTDSSS
jgi:hypothetical protein